MLRDGIEQLVLSLREEHLRGLVCAVIVAAECKEVAHLLVEPLLGCADVPYPGKQLIEVVRSAVRVFEPLVVHGEALDQVLLQMARGPLTELRTAEAFCAEADSYDHLKGVEDNAVAFPVGSRCHVMRDSIAFIELLFLKYAAYVVAYRLFGDCKKVCHLLLAEPDFSVPGVK